jgi:hypothetical protein
MYTTMKPLVILLNALPHFSFLPFTPFPWSGSQKRVE